jgi:Tol biopolymer transport system component
MPTLTGIAGKLLTGSVSRVDELFGEKKILAFDGVVQARFGWSVAVGSGRIVVGAYGDDDNDSYSGSAYIFDLNGNQLAKITASDGAYGDLFGVSVAIGNGRIVVGARLDDDNGAESGSAYIFDLDGNQLAKLTASDGAANDYFGNSVAIGSDRIVVGAYRDSVGANTRQGSAYIFDLDGTQLTKITASDGAASDQFGNSVAIGSDRIVVGAYGDDGNGSGTYSGSVYVFDLDGTQLTKITASDGAASDFFGISVAAGGNKIVVGSYGDDDNGSYSGSVYTYNLDGTNENKIIPSDGVAADNFGQSVAVGENKIVVGAPGYDIDPITFTNFNSGKIYIYDLDGTNELIITNLNLTTMDSLGRSLAVGNDRLVAGILDDDNGQNSGAVYIYKTANT